MATNALVQTRIDGKIKNEAAAVLATMGLTMSDAVRLLLTKVAREHALPFNLNTPNPEARAAITELESGKGTRFDSVDSLMADLNADD